LGSLFGEIYVPVEVKEEIESGLREGVDLPNLLEVDFVKIYDCKCQVFLPVVRDLGRGEAAVIFSGLKEKDALVVLDDNLARQVARELGLKVTGTAGILIVAKQKGLIKKVKFYLERLKEKGFYLSSAHEQIILKQAGEKI
jgi:predicted nucleic acid-binding protein